MHSMQQADAPIHARTLLTYAMQACSVLQKPQALASCSAFRFGIEGLALRRHHANSACAFDVTVLTPPPEKSDQAFKEMLESIARGISCTQGAGRNMRRWLRERGSTRQAEALHEKRVVKHEKWRASSHEIDQQARQRILEIREGADRAITVPNRPRQRCCPTHCRTRAPRPGTHTPLGRPARDGPHPSASLVGAPMPREAMRRSHRTLGATDSCETQVAGPRPSPVAGT